MYHISNDIFLAYWVVFNIDYNKNICNNFTTLTVPLKQLFMLGET